MFTFYIISLILVLVVTFPLVLRHMKYLGLINSLLMLVISFVLITYVGIPLASYHWGFALVLGVMNLHNSVDAILTYRLESYMTRVVNE